MIEMGAKRICFAARRYWASTVEKRIAGYREVLFAAQMGETGAVLTGDFEDVGFVRGMLERERTDAIVCANDQAGLHGDRRGGDGDDAGSAAEAASSGEGCGGKE
jgi:DNA-binding LacI/PurR family transcriptional regulator